jgi:hypothetical protein
MRVHDTKRNGNHRLARALLAGILALSLHLAGARSESPVSFGIYTGQSLSMGDEFIEMIAGGHTFNSYTPNFVLGVYFQFNLSPHFGLQLNMNHQNCTNRWEFHYWDRHDRGRKSLGAFSISLNGVVTASRTPMSRFYILGGAGFLAGSFENLGTLFQLTLGPGVNLRLKPGSPASFVLAATLNPLFYSYGKSRTPVYLKVQAGIEMELRERKQKKEEE